MVGSQGAKRRDHAKQEGVCDASWCAREEEFSDSLRFLLCVFCSVRKPSAWAEARQEEKEKEIIPFVALSRRQQAVPLSRNVSVCAGQRDRVQILKFRLFYNFSERFPGHMTSTGQADAGSVDDVLDLNPTSFVDDVYNAVRPVLSTRDADWIGGYERRPLVLAFSPSPSPSLSPTTRSLRHVRTAGGASLRQRF